MSGLFFPPFKRTCRFLKIAVFPGKGQGKKTPFCCGNCSLENSRKQKGPRRGEFPPVLMGQVVEERDALFKSKRVRGGGMSCLFTHMRALPFLVRNNSSPYHFSCAVSHPSGSRRSLAGSSLQIPTLKHCVQGFMDKNRELGIFLMLLILP